LKSSDHRRFSTCGAPSYRSARTSTNPLLIGLGIGVDIDLDIRSYPSPAARRLQPY
jgi:hypothetical protein